MEDQIAVDVKEAVQGINKLISNVSSLKKQIDNISKSNGISNINKQLKQSESIGQALKNTFNFGAIYLGARKVLSTFKDMTNESVDYAETVNLFNVSMGKGLEGLNQYYEKAVKFQNDLQEKLGVNIAESMNYQALFNSMSKSMGTSAKYAYTLSENFTKLGYDLASLHNIDPENVMQKLRAGLAGQTKPLRDLGLDITQQSLQPIVDGLGIERSVKNMSQAEKMILRYIAVLKQAQIAQGDFANTMESPANQLRIFNAQVIAFKRNMGNLWQGFLGGILPYVNAIMMVINELLKMVAKLFGFKVSEQKVNISASIGVDDLASDLGNAGKKAKELKAQLMGFDEINNISLPHNSSGGSGSSGGGAGGIDQRLLDAIKGYDNMMDSVKNKATEIRDKMLEWLGFHRTDEGGWELNEGLTNMGKILNVVKTIGVAIGTWKVASTVTKLLNNLGLMNKTQGFKIAFGATLLLTGIYLLYKGIKHLLEGDIDVFTVLETVLGGAGVTFGIASILNGTLTTIPLGNAIKIGFGVTLALTGIFMEYNSVKKMLEGDISLGTILQGTGSAFLIGIGAWLLTGSPIVGLIATAGVLAFNLGIEIGIALKNVDWQEVKDFFTVTIPETLQGFVEWVSQKWGEFKEWLSEIPGNLGYIAGQIVGDIVIFFTQAIPEKWNDFINWLSNLPSEIWNKLCEIGNNVKTFFTETIPQTWNTFKEWLFSKWEDLKKWFEELPDKFIEFGKNIIQGLIDGIKNAWNGFWTAVDEFIQGFIQGFKDKLGIHSPSTVFEGFGGNIIQGLKQGMQNRITEIKNKICEVASGVKTWFSEKIANISEKGKEVITKIKTGVEISKSILSSKIREVAGNVKGWFTNNLGNLQSIGNNIIAGIKDGIMNNVYKISSAISNVASSTVGWFKEKLGIHSPSRIMRDMVGKFIPLGIAEGIDEQSDSVYDSIHKLNDGIKVNSQDFVIDTNQFIDYGQISGAIQAQSNVNINSDISQRVYEAVIEGMRNSKIRADVRVEADKQGIFKTVQASAEEYAMQTGENPFPSLA